MNETTTNYVALSELEILLKEDGTVTLIDARTPEEFKEGHARGAINVPIAEMTEFAKSRGGANDGVVVTMCGSTGRGEKAAAILDSLGARNVLVLEGGLKMWRNAGLPVA
jgi:phage shock protein E